jgi:hypothetical protein
MPEVDGTSRAASDRVPDTLRPPRRHRCDDDGEPALMLDVGHATVTLYERTVTHGEREQWRAEDLARDARRIPLGFRAPD